MKLNIGCGEKCLEGFVNIDFEEGNYGVEVKPDLICNVAKDPLPYDAESVEEIYCIHNIEHISMRCWAHLFNEFRRVLIDEGLLVLAYPEFEICSKYFLENKLGQRAFWRACLYGRQLYPGDYHLTPMISSELSEILRQSGFHNVVYAPDIDADYYTFLRCNKGKIVTKETILGKELFGNDHQRLDTRFTLVEGK